MIAPTRTELLQARQRLGMTQCELADRLGLAVSTVARWEAGNTRPPAYLRLALAHIGAMVAV